MSQWAASARSYQLPRAGRAKPRTRRVCSWSQYVSRPNAIGRRRSRQDRRLLAAGGTQVFERHQPTSVVDDTGQVPMPPPRRRSDRPQINQSDREHQRRGGRFRGARPIRKVADYRAGSADPRHRPVAASGVVVRPGDARGFAELPIFPDLQRVWRSPVRGERNRREHLGEG